MTGKKHKPGWVLGKGLGKKSKGLPRTPEGHSIIRGYIHKLQSELTESERKKMEGILADRDVLRKQLEQEKLEEFENPTLDEYEEAMSYLREVCQRRLTPLQEIARRRVVEEDKTDEQTAKELGISKGNVSTILKQIKNKCRKLITRKFPPKGSLDNK